MVSAKFLVEPGSSVAKQWEFSLFMHDSTFSMYIYDLDTFQNHIGSAFDP